MFESVTYLAHVCENLKGLLADTFLNCTAENDNSLLHSVVCGLTQI